MTHRPAPLQVFIDAAARAFTAHTKDPDGARVVDAVFAALRHGGTASDTAPTLVAVAANTPAAANTFSCLKNNSPAP